MRHAGGSIWAQHNANRLYECISEKAFLEKGDRRPELLKLVKALYGIKQAPRVWNSLIDAFMKRMEFASLISDPGTYVRLSRSGRPIIVTLYVDDKMILVAPEDEDEWKEIEKRNRHHIQNYKRRKMRMDFTHVGSTQQRQAHDGDESATLY
jgi:hypothetical protein